MFMRRMLFPLTAFDGEGGGGGGPASAPAPVADPPKPDNNAAFAELRRKADEAERRAKAAEDAIAARDRADAEAQGKWEEIAKTAEAARVKAEADAARIREERMVERLASSLKFHNPADVMHRLTPEQRADEAQAKVALEQIAKTDKYLVRQDAAPTPELGQVLEPSATLKETAKTPLTMESIKAMSQDEMNDRLDEVQAFLANAQQ
jgi:hypothetical protein